MSANDPVTRLKAEATCSICKEFYRDPATLDCGHSFCRACIDKYIGKEEDLDISCPECKQKFDQNDLKPNKKLRNMTEMIQELATPGVGLPEGGLCKEHRMERKFFCDSDWRAICRECKESDAHKEHAVRSLAEAEDEYKRKLWGSLPALREEMAAILKDNYPEKMSGEYWKLETETRTVIDMVRKLHRFLKKQEQELTRRLEEMQSKFEKAENARRAKLSRQHLYFNKLVTQIEVTCRQPAVELLKEARSIAATYAKMKFPYREAMTGHKVRVTLDPDTASSWLVLSEGGSRVRETVTEQTWPDDPKRFTDDPCVLGAQGFAAGCHYWELDILNEGEAWTVGVASESVPRKGGLKQRPKSGVWAVKRRYDLDYYALTSTPIPLYPHEDPKKLGLYLDYEAGRLSVYNADTWEQLYTFTGAAFAGKLFPFFRLHTNAELRLV